MREARTEEHDDRILDPETRRSCLDTALQRVKSINIVRRLRHIRLHADEGGCLIAAGGFDGGHVEDVGHEVLEEGFEDAGFVHGGVAVVAQDAALDVEEGSDHGCLSKGDCEFDRRLCGAAVLDRIGGGEGQDQDQDEELVELEKMHCQHWSRS